MSKQNYFLISDFFFNEAEISSAMTIDSNFIWEGAGHHVHVTFIDWFGPCDIFPLKALYEW